MEDQRALLDSLMGDDRNSGKNQGKKAHWKDDHVCKKFLAWDCPCDFFLNQRGYASTKSPLGDCGRQHIDNMKARFEEDKDSSKYRRKYMQELEKELKRHVESINLKIEREKEKLEKGESFGQEAQSHVLTEINTRSTLVKDKLLAAEEMANSGEVDVSKAVFTEAMTLSHEQARLERLKEKTEGWIDEICDVCGAYMSWREPEEMKKRERGEPHSHLCGIVHRGWAALRDSYKRLKEELKSLPPLTEEELRSMDDDEPAMKRRRSDRDGDRGRDDRRRTGDDRDDRRDRDRRDRDREGGRDRGDDRRRDKDDRGYRDNRDRRDRGKRRPRSESLDEFGRCKTAPAKKPDAAGSSGRKGSISVHVQYSKDWQEVMAEKFADLHLDQDEWDMTAFDQRGKIIHLDSEVVEVNKDSFPLHFRFERKGQGKATSDDEDSDTRKTVQVEYSEEWEEVMNEKFEALQLEQDAWNMTAFDRRGKKIQLDAEVVEINEDSFPLKFRFTKKK